MYSQGKYCYLICYLFLCRYIFKNQKKAGLQELGPRFTLKLRSLQRGSFDSKFGEYEWIHKVCSVNDKWRTLKFLDTTILTAAANFAVTNDDT